MNLSLPGDAANQTGARRARGYQFSLAFSSAFTRWEFPSALLARRMSPGAVDGTEPDCCVICLDPLRPNERVALSGCGHDAFHAQCLVTALQRSRSCPLCRYTVGDTDTEESSSDSDEESVVSTTTEEWFAAVRVWKGRRKNAVRRALRRRSRSARAEALVSQYRRHAAEIRDHDTELRGIRQEVEVYKRGIHKRLRDVRRDHDREMRKFNARAARCQTRRAACVQHQKTAEDALAATAGFDEPFPQCVGREWDPDDFS